MGGVDVEVVAEQVLRVELRLEPAQPVQGARGERVGDPLGVAVALEAEIQTVGLPAYRLEPPVERWASAPITVSEKVASRWA